MNKSTLELANQAVATINLKGRNFIEYLPLILYKIAFCRQRLFRTCGPWASTVGTEELGHLEMVGAIVHQLTRNLTADQIKESGFDAYFVDHTTGVFPQFASGFPWSAATMQVTGDTVADLTEDLAADAAMV